MNYIPAESQRPRRNIRWQQEPPPVECEHTFDVVAHVPGGDLRRCSKCQRLEPE